MSRLLDRQGSVTAGGAPCSPRPPSHRTTPAPARDPNAHPDPQAALRPRGQATYRGCAPSPGGSRLARCGEAELPDGRRGQLGREKRLQLQGGLRCNRGSGYAGAPDQGRLRHTSCGQAGMSVQVGAATSGVSAQSPPNLCCPGRHRPTCHPRRARQMAGRKGKPGFARPGVGSFAGDGALRRWRGLLRCRAGGGLASPARRPPRPAGRRFFRGPRQAQG